MFVEIVSKSLLRTKEFSLIEKNKPIKWLEPNIMNSIITIFFFSDTLNLTFIGY